MTHTEGAAMGSAQVEEWAEQRQSVWLYHRLAQSEPDARLSGRRAWRGPPWRSHRRPGVPPSGCGSWHLFRDASALRVRGPCWWRSGSAACLR